MVEPWTRDARVRADIVGVAPDLSGLVSDLLVQDNDLVKKGDTLFKVDVQRFQIALDQAEAALAGSQASLDQADAANRQAAANLALARLNRERSEVKAPVNGKITNLILRPGDYVTTGSPQIALVDTDSFRIEAYFEETKLARVQIGDAALIRLMGQPETIHEHVASIAAGIEDSERTPSNGLLPNINPTLQLGAARATHPGQDCLRFSPSRCAAGFGKERDGGDTLMLTSFSKHTCNPAAFCDQQLRTVTFSRIVPILHLGFNSSSLEKCRMIEERPPSGEFRCDRTN